MNPATEEKLARVRKYSASLRNLFRLFQVIVIIGSLISVLMVLTTSNTNSTLVFIDTAFQGEELTLTVRLVTLTGMLLIFAIGLKLLHHLKTLFGLFATGEIFTADTVLHIRQIGISIFLFLAVWLYAILARVLFLATGQGGRVADGVNATISFGLNYDTFLMAIGGIIIIVISWIMDVGREMREEQDLTV
jgi:hypothetical protein